MKKTILVFATLALSVSAMAQTADDGIKMYKYGRYQTAIADLTPLAAGNAMANYYLGLSQLGTEDVNGAKATFSKFPEDPANMAGLARVAFLQNNPSLGAQIAANVAGKAKKKEWQPLKYAADALTYSDGADYQQAVTWYKKALESTQDEDVHISLGDAYQKIQGGGGEAMNNYEDVTGKDPKNSLAYSRIGALWYAARNYPSALENYGKAKDADPSNPIPYRDLATAYYLVGKYDLALQNIQTYMGLSDKSVNDQILYINILYFSKHYSEAIQQAQQLINSGVKKPQLYGILGFSQAAAHDSVNALQNERIYFGQMDPKRITPSDYLNFAQVFTTNKLSDSADYYYNKAITSDTSQNKSDTYRKIAESFKDAKEYAKSAIWYNRLITEYPATQPLDYFWAGAMYYYAKDYTNAARAFEAFENKYPTEASATYWRGRVAAAQDPEGKEGTAVPYFTKWVNTVGPAYEKKNDLKIAYEYLLVNAYQKHDKENMQKYEDLLTPIDPNDDLVKQIKDAEKSGAPKKTTAPAKGKK